MRLFNNVIDITLFCRASHRHIIQGGKKNILPTVEQDECVCTCVPDALQLLPRYRFVSLRYSNQRGLHLNRRQYPSCHPTYRKLEIYQ